jgi:hypothetical protein
LRCKDIQENVIKYQKQLNNLIESTSKKYENDPDNLEILLSNIKNYIYQVDSLKTPLATSTSKVDFFLLLYSFSF